jgi:hypothetical protein
VTTSGVLNGGASVFPGRGKSGGWPRGHRREERWSGRAAGSRSDKRRRYPRSWFRREFYDPRNSSIRYNAGRFTQSLLSICEPQMNPDTEPHVTFWSIPPFRQRLRAIAKTISVREVRVLVAEIYGIFYALYGFKIPFIVLLAVASILGPGPSSFDFTMAAVPYLLPAAFLSLAFGGLAGGGMAWFILGRAIQSRLRRRVHWAIWAALGMSAPALLPLFVVGSSHTFSVVGIFLLVSAFGGAIGFGSHWVVQRDQSEKAGSSAVPL